MLNKYLNKILIKINDHASSMGNPYQVFGIFGAITYPLYYWIWANLDETGYENLRLRLIAFALCVPLVFIKKWPHELKKYIALYWYATLCYCLPFLFTFFLLKNNFSFAWSLNAMTVIVLSILLLDLRELLIILSVGISAGWFVFTLTDNTVPHFAANSTAVLITYASAIIFGALFAHRKMRLQNEKLRTINTVAESIAHELRTPLRAIHASAEGLKLYLPKLIHSYSVAKHAKLNIPDIDETHYASLTRALGNIASEAQSAFTFIDILLVNANESNINRNRQPCSILSCIQETMNCYPFDSQNKSLVTIENTPDFIFYGDKQLTIHVLFNLLKNALYSIKAANKGKIFIKTMPGQTHNYLYFRDTGLGIEASLLPKIFERFFSRTYHGTGIGLAFCKLVMENLGGEINVNAKINEYAEFILSFPIVTQDIGEKGEYVEKH